GKAAPLVADGNFYWIERDSTSQGEAPRPTQIMRADGSGSQRAMLTFPDDGDKRLVEMFQHRGKLYVLYEKDVTGHESRSGAGSYGGVGDVIRRDYYLARLLPERSDPLGESRRLPEDANFQSLVFDGDYCYFTTQETQQSGWARLMGEPNSSSNTINAL